MQFYCCRRLQASDAEIFPYAGMFVLLLQTSPGFRCRDISLCRDVCFTAADVSRLQMQRYFPMQGCLFYCCRRLQASDAEIFPYAWTFVLLLQTSPGFRCRDISLCRDVCFTAADVSRLQMQRYFPMQGCLFYCCRRLQASDAEIFPYAGMFVLLLQTSPDFRCRDISLCRDVCFTAADVSRLQMQRYFPMQGCLFYCCRRLQTSDADISLCRDVCCSHLGLIMRKPVNALCEQQRRRSACASMLSDQRLCCSMPG